MSAQTPWPVAAFDPVRRLHVIAAVTPGAAVREALLDAPFDQVWAAAADLEGGLPRWLPDIREVRLAAPREGGRPQALVIGRTRLRARFDLELEPGWCLMRSRFLLGGMAARAEPDGTRFAFLGAFRTPAGGLLGRALRPATEPLAGRSLRRFARLVREG
ncbi:SRPBCC family protein [Kitasatospora sp. NPDC050463]|uniref:SRPBCC family protein n=1 Tax=Kitasatospora sp. NPDC050463 TaxID=3155786 RepID=UPI0033DB1A3B